MVDNNSSILLSKLDVRAVTDDLHLDTHRQVKQKKHLRPPEPRLGAEWCSCIECAEIEQGPRIKNPIPKIHDPWAGFTCNWCPSDRRPQESVSQPNGWVNTKRCSLCNAKSCSYYRARVLASQILDCRLDLCKRARFVTLTLPNYLDWQVGLADLKKKIRNFRHTQTFKSKVVGGVDFYEYTTSDGTFSPKGTFNVHYHGIWIGDYWKQDNLLESWKHGGASIELIKKKWQEADTVRYCTKYVHKQKIQGIRCQQKFGCMYNSKQVPD